jgi:hypothetical protein
MQLERDGSGLSNTVTPPLVVCTADAIARFCPVGAAVSPSLLLATVF